MLKRIRNWHSEKYYLADLERTEFFSGIDRAPAYGWVDGSGSEDTTCSSARHIMQPVRCFSFLAG